MSYTIILPAFEGPLDLLLHLIKVNKIDIYDIPIARITEQYVQYIESMKELNIEIASEFLIMAATLIHIKSRMLLPVDEEVEEEENDNDPRTELVEKLIEYQAVKDISKSFREMEERFRNIFFRSLPESFESSDELYEGHIEIDLYGLFEAYRKLTHTSVNNVVTIEKDILTVKDRINALVELLEQKQVICFDHFVDDGLSRLTIIATFLALLEVARLGLALVSQEHAFAPIWIRKNND
jgi:segregation and condensation protein A